MKPSVVVWGASGHALVVADILRLNGQYFIAGFLDDVNLLRHKKPFCDSFILGGEEQLDTLIQSGIKCLIFGFGNNDERLRLSEIVRKKGFNLVTAVHPSAIIAQGVKIGAGTVIAAGVVINPGSIIGENVIINTSSSIDHGCIIHDGVHISPGAHLAGSVTVGRGTWIGIGTTIIDHIQIGSGTIIGAGSVVTKNVPDNVVSYGTPARIKRKL